jgi:hypothetical protein
MPSGNEKARVGILALLVPGQVPDKNVGIYTEHQRASSSIGTGSHPVIVRIACPAERTAVQW